MFQIKYWLADAKKYARADFLAGLTLWALLVPQSIAYAKLAGAPTPLAGLYCLIVGMPVYAIFASSRSLIASPTTAVSATFAGFLAAMMSEPAAAFQALVLGTAIGYFVFWFFRLGFLTNFISMPVSLGYLSGLSIIVVIKQIPDLLGYSSVDGNLFQQAVGIFTDIGQTNVATAIFSVVILAIMVFLPKVTRVIPAGLVAVIVSMLASYFLHLENDYQVEMVGALPKSAPEFQLMNVKLSDLAIIIPASLGLVILASGEASVTAEAMATKHSQHVDMNQQFFAFGMGNLASALTGGMLGTGASSATMVSEDSGTKTLMATIWAALATLLTLLFLAGLFAYLPSAFLAALVITSVWKMLNFRGIWAIHKFMIGEFLIALTAQVSVIVFGILNGLLMSMLINVFYYAYTTSRIRVEKFGYSEKDPRILVPLRYTEAHALPEGYIGIGIEQGQIFYASANAALNGAMKIVENAPDAKTVVISLERMFHLDYTSFHQVQAFQSELQQHGKKLILTEIHTETLMQQLEAMNFDPDWVTIKTSLDMSKLS